MKLLAFVVLFVGCATLPPTRPDLLSDCGDGSWCEYRFQCKPANATHDTPYCEYIGPEQLPGGEL